MSFGVTEIVVFTEGLVMEEGASLSYPWKNDEHIPGGNLLHFIGNRICSDNQAVDVELSSACCRHLKETFLVYPYQDRQTSLVMSKLTIWFTIVEPKPIFSEKESTIKYSLKIETARVYVDE